VLAEVRELVDHALEIEPASAGYQLAWDMNNLLVERLNALPTPEPDTDSAPDTSCPRRDDQCDPMCAEWAAGERRCMEPDTDSDGTNQGEDQ
jgi:hypothetical protein